MKRVLIENNVEYDEDSLQELLDYYQQLGYHDDFDIADAATFDPTSGGGGGGLYENDGSIGGYDVNNEGLINMYDENGNLRKGLENLYDENGELRKGLDFYYDENGELREGLEQFYDENGNLRENFRSNSAPDNRFSGEKMGNLETQMDEATK